MKYVISIIIVIITTSLHLAQAQNKDLSYYVDHPTEILPAARASFNAGQYKRTQDLCRFQPLLPDYQKLECAKLNADARKCDSLRVVLLERIMDAKSDAQVLLRINPKDSTAKEVLLLNEPESEVAIATDYEPMAVDQNAGTGATYWGDASAAELDMIKGLELKPINNEDAIIADKVQQVDVAPSEQSTISNESKLNPKKQYHSRLYVGAGVMLNGGFLVMPEVAAGLYDIKGSRFGVELGTHFHTSSNNKELGVNASLVIRLSNRVYSKLHCGYCYHKNINYSVSSGLLGVGISYSLFNHLNVGANVKYRVAAFPSPSGFFISLPIGWVF